MTTKESIHPETSLSRLLDSVRALLADGDLPSREILDALVYAWGNVIWSANAELLEKMIEMFIRVRGPLLECGSGLSTIVLGLLADIYHTSIWTLEDNYTCYRYTKHILAKYHIRNVSIFHAPLSDYGHFSWYTPPMEKLPPYFRSVLCDGPISKTTKGGRYGLIPVMSHKLCHGCVILLDDAARDSEKKVIEEWSRELTFSLEMLEIKSPCAVLTLL